MGPPIAVVPTTPLAEALRTMVVIVAGTEGEQDLGKGGIDSLAVTSLPLANEFSS